MDIKDRFRGFLPVVIDLETGGFENEKHAVLEIAIVLLDWSENQIIPGSTYHWNIEPQPNLIIEEASLAITGIDLSDPNRNAIQEDKAIRECFKIIRRAVKNAKCQRAILTAHNAHFDHGFIMAASDRNEVKRNPFHPFSVIDTASLSALALGHTVLSEACQRAGVQFESEKAHSATHDAEVTAELFCRIVNSWRLEHGLSGGSVY